MSPQPTSHLPSIDPSAPGTIIRTALLFESVTTIGAGLYFLLLPHRYLLTTMGASTTQTTTTAVQMTQQFGAANILVGTVVGLFVSNSRKSIEARQTLYVVLLVFELCYVPLLLWQALMDGGMPRKAFLDAVKMFVVFVAWRGFTIGWKPEWFGRCVEGRKRE